MRSAVAIPLLSIAAALGPAGSLRADSSVPALAADAFGREYHDVLGHTIVYAQVGWLQLFYRHSGDTPAQPPPGWIRLNTRPAADMSGTDRIMFHVGDGRDVDGVIHSQGYPYFAITLEQARRIANAPQATATAVREASNQVAKRVVTMTLSSEQRRLIGHLADHGSDWKPPDRPWEIGGAAALVVDLRPAARARLDQVKSLLVKEIERRERTKDPFLLVRTGPNFYPFRSPAVRGTAHHKPGASWYEPAEPRTLVSEMSVMPDDTGSSLGTMAMVVKDQQLQSMVAFLPDGPPLTDPDRVENELRGELPAFRRVARRGRQSKRTVRAAEGVGVQTRGQFVTLPPADGEGTKSP